MFIVQPGIGVYVFDLLWGCGSSSMGCWECGWDLPYFPRSVVCKGGIEDDKRERALVMGVMRCFFSCGYGFFLSTLHYLERHFVVVAYVAV